jgi:hypothetical protein
MLTVFWSRYNGTQGAPTTSDAGDHQVAHIEAYRGCKTTGNPFNISSGGIDASGPTTLNMTGATTDSNNCLIVLAVADDYDNASTARYSAWTNANLANILERWDNGTATGNGGGIGVATGELKTAAAYGVSTVTQLSAILVDGYMTIALQGKTVKGRARKIKILSGGDK